MIHKIELPIEKESEKKWVIYGNDIFLKQWEIATRDALLAFIKQNKFEQNKKEKNK